MNAYDAKKWGIIILGQDSIFPCKSFEHAVEKCSELNEIIAKEIKPRCNTEYHPICWVEIALWDDIGGNLEHNPEEVNWDDPFED